MQREIVETMWHQHHPQEYRVQDTSAVLVYDVRGCVSTYLGGARLRQLRQQMFSHVLIHMQPTAVGGAGDEALD